MKQRIVLEFEREDDDHLYVQAMLDQMVMGGTVVSAMNSSLHRFQFILDKCSAHVTVDLTVTALAVDPLNQVAKEKLEEP